ncbi:Unknown protein sequence [Pseudomonas savastanoi pv. phaseolicola]|nr:Unknown protein sequence [Pseudomonas savastanoi pv. phaseolicola]KPB73321.1 Unknown protein sequence [Pseudomonas amygdali pv. mellea]
MEALLDLKPTLEMQARMPPPQGNAKTKACSTQRQALYAQSAKELK